MTLLPLWILVFLIADCGWWKPFIASRPGQLLLMRWENNVRTSVMNIHN
jgi:hypothetical protein